MMKVRALKRLRKHGDLKLIQKFFCLCEQTPCLWLLFSDIHSIIVDRVEDVAFSQIPR